MCRRFSEAELLSELSLEHFDTCCRTNCRTCARAHTRRDWQAERELWTHRREVGVSGDGARAERTTRERAREEESVGERDREGESTRARL